MWKVKSVQFHSSNFARNHVVSHQFTLHHRIVCNQSQPLYASRKIASAEFNSRRWLTNTLPNKNKHQSSHSASNAMHVKDNVHSGSVAHSFQTSYESKKIIAMIDNGMGGNNNKHDIYEQDIAGFMKMTTIENKQNDHIDDLFLINSKKSSALQNKLMMPIKKILPHFLPAHYPHSVTSNYILYSKWQALHSIFGSATGVLSMQSMLLAVGVGSAAAAPTAAAFNWIVKDGLGQLGGVLCASFINTRMDADPKKWRMMSAVLIYVSTFLELLTPLVPSLFLLLAGTANMGKNLSWLAAAATKAAVHRYNRIKKIAIPFE
jgi:hypothetical protein